MDYRKQAQEWLEQNWQQIPTPFNVKPGVTIVNMETFKKTQLARLAEKTMESKLAYLRIKELKDKWIN